MQPYTTSSLAEYREGIGTLRANGGDLGGGSETLIANTLTAGAGQRYDFESDTFALAFPWQSALDPIGQPSDVSGTLIKNQTMAVACNVADTLSVGANQTTGFVGDVVAQSIAYPMHGGMIGRQEQNGPSGSGFGNESDPSYTLTAGGQVRHGVAAIMQPIGAFFSGQGAKAGSIAYDENVAPTLKASDSGTNRTPSAHIAMQVRRLTPVECERLQGFPDGYTNIPWRKNPESPDGPRYKALGNSMAVPVMAWIGKRIKQVSEL
jgi:DNA (cytosine-5)-methyltransferase 1